MVPRLWFSSYTMMSGGWLPTDAAGAAAPAATDAVAAAAAAASMSLVFMFPPVPVLPVLEGGPFPAGRPRSPASRPGLKDR
jgi:hypothetical protein